MKNIIKNLRISGFTLLELLVVIGIMGVMMALATVAYSATQRSGRDARRKQDMIAMQNAMEQYYSANSFTYPDICSAAGTYLKSTWPTDPSNVVPYIYNDALSGTCTSASYCICATMEGAGGNSGGADCSFAVSNKTYYCVGSLQ